MEYPVTLIRQAAQTRPADTTTYTAGDAVGGASAVWNFPPVHPQDKKAGKVTGARLFKNDTGVTADGFTLLLFRRNPTAQPADNAAPTTSFIAIADAASFIGSIAFNATGVVLAAGVYYEAETLVPAGGIPYQTTDGIIYGILTAQGAYEPASAEVFTIMLQIEQ